jgi:hypothetical protein
VNMLHAITADADAVMTKLRSAPMLSA